MKNYSEKIKNFNKTSYKHFWNIKNLKVRILSGINCYRDFKNYKKIINIGKINKEVTFVVKGGLGDHITATQFVNKLRKILPKTKIKIGYRSWLAKADPKSFSYDRPRKYKIDEENVGDPILEWIESFYKVDEIIPMGKIEYKNTLKFYPYGIGLFAGWEKPKTVNKNYLEKTFSELKFNKSAQEIFITLKKRKEKGEKIIFCHLRRNSKKILSLIEEIYNSELNTHIVLLGSTEHQLIPYLSESQSSTSLINSYEKNINTIELLKLIRDADLFIGGRGGFEYFAWWSEIPTINIFDEEGIFEIHNYIWRTFLWKNNVIPYLFTNKNSIKEIYECINYYFNKNKSWNYQP